MVVGEQRRHCDRLADSIRARGDRMPGTPRYLLTFAGLAQAHVERLAAFLSRSHFELDFVTLAQVFEIHLRPQARAMKKHFVAAVVRNDEAEALVLDHLLDSAEHAINSSAAGASMA